MGVAARVLVDRDEAGHAAAPLIFGPHRVAGALRGDHQHVEIGARLDQVEVNVESMGEHERRALFHIGRKLIAVNLGLQFVRRQHHHDVRPFGGRRDVHHLDAFGLRLFGGRRARPQRDRDLLHAAVAHVEEMRVALAAVADHRHFLGFDQIEIGVLDHNTHACFVQPSRNAALRRNRSQASPRRTGVSSECGGCDQARPAEPGSAGFGRQEDVIAGGLMAFGAL